MAQQAGILAQAVEHIADAQRRIDRQRQLIEELERDRHDTKEARELLETMVKLLEQMERHRSYLLEQMARPAQRNR